MSAGGQTLALRQLAHDAAATLAAGGVDNATAEARWMVEDASGLGPGALSTEGGQPATVGAVQRVEAMVARRCGGEPLQYVLGHWPFRSLDLMVDARVLIPRPETEEVVGVALGELECLCNRRSRDDQRSGGSGSGGASGRGGRPLVVVDLGTGSGAIALSIASERPSTEVVATDRSTAALAVAAANLAGIGMAGASVQLCEGDWFTALEHHRPDLAGAVDLIVANPPYVAAGEVLPAEVVDHEPLGALVAGPRGTEDLERIVVGAPLWLAPDGVLVVECAPTQTQALAALARAHGYADVRVAPDLTGRERMVVARRTSADPAPQAPTAPQSGPGGR